MDKNISLIEELKSFLEKMINNLNDKQILIFDNGADCLSSIDMSKQTDVKYQVSDIYSHSFTEICMCVNGRFALQFGNHIHEVEEGDIGVVLPGVLHNEIILKDNEYLSIWMAFDIFKTTLHLSGSNDKGNFCVVDGCYFKSDYEFNNILNYIRTEFNNQSIYHMYLIKANLLKLIIIVLRKAMYSMDGTNALIWKETVVSDIKEYIENNCAKHIKLEDISQKLCIGITYLNVIFKSVTGMTIIQFSNDFKIEKAKHLLKNTNCSIKDMSLQLGFYDQYHFSKSFKNKTGYAPAQYRKLVSDYTLK